MSKVKTICKMIKPRPVVAASAASLRMQPMLLVEIKQAIKRNNITSTKVADLQAGKIHLFTVDLPIMLISIATALVVALTTVSPLKSPNM